MMRREEGFTLIEVLAAAVILLVGIVAALQAFDSSRKLTLTAERQTSLAHRGQAELERVKSLPYNQLGLTGASSSWSSGTGATAVSNPSGSCPPTGNPPTYQPTNEALVIDGCSYTANGTTSAYTTGTVAPTTAWTDGRFSGTVYDFITYTPQDQKCGSYCPTSNNYKRITVVVTLAGVTQPVAVVSTYVADPSLNSPQNLLKNAGTTCTQGTQTTSCSVTPPGTPSPNFLCDASYASGCGQPACTGNVLAQTLGTAGLIAAVPDLAGTNLPTGMCATPPCYGTNLLAGCQGVPINPSGNSTCGTGPPVDNTKAHAWVGPSIPTGTTVTLTGAGAMTTFLESTTGAAVNATLCLRLYVVPNSSLGLLNSLLSTPISAVISANVTAAAGVPAPATFEFPSSAITANTAVSASLGPVRIEFVVWIAGSTSPVQMVYDQAQYASEITLMTK